MKDQYHQKKSALPLRQTNTKIQKHLFTLKPWDFKLPKIWSLQNFFGSLNGSHPIFWICRDPRRQATVCLMWVAKFRWVIFSEKATTSHGEKTPWCIKGRFFSWGGVDSINHQMNMSMLVVPYFLRLYLSLWRF